MLVGSGQGIGEWGFAGLLEADGRRVLIDTGSHPETVLQNARDMKIDLSNVKELIITHKLDTPKGLVVITGCGHAGVVNILTYAREHFPNTPVEALIGGLHVFAASDEQLNWTGDKLKEFKVANLVGAHCTGIEALYKLRERIGLTRKSALVGSVGGSYSLASGIVPAGLER